MNWPTNDDVARAWTAEWRAIYPQSDNEGLRHLREGSAKAMRAALVAGAGPEVERLARELEHADYAASEARAAQESVREQLAAEFMPANVVSGIADVDTLVKHAVKHHAWHHDVEDAAERQRLETNKWAGTEIERLSAEVATLTAQAEAMRARLNAAEGCLTHHIGVGHDGGTRPYCAVCDAYDEDGRSIVREHQATCPFYRTTEPAPDAGKGEG